MKRAILFHLIVLLALNSYSQKKAKLKPIQSDIHLSLKAPIEDGRQQIYLFIETKELFECTNTFIQAELIRQDDAINLKVSGMMHPRECDEGLKPAWTQVNLTDIPLGEYSFKAQYRNYDPFKATLLVTERTLKFVLHEQAMISMVRPIIRKIPQNTIWGELKFSKDLDRETAEGFLVDLENEQCEITDLKPGDYGAFYLRKTGKQDERKFGEKSFEIPFVYHYEGDFDRLELLVKMYSEKPESSLRINLSDEKGNAIITFD